MIHFGKVKNKFEKIVLFLFLILSFFLLGKRNNATSKNKSCFALGHIRGPHITVLYWDPLTNYSGMFTPLRKMGVEYKVIYVKDRIAITFHVKAWG
ncbi:hypothetical protein ACJX0J_024703, partial [Zea mays]